MCGRQKYYVLAQKEHLMIHNVLKEEIRVPGTLSDTYLETYLLEITPKFLVQERPLILVCPGGGYRYTSDHSGLPRRRISLYLRKRGGDRRHAV